MAKSQQSFQKKEKEKQRLKKKQDKQEKMDARKVQKEENGPENMIAYVDENGNISDTPPDPSKKRIIDADSIVVGVPKKEKVVMDPVHTGTVQFFNDSKGYGFIVDAINKESYFVHINGCVDQITEGNLVSFELERGMKGMNAVKVTKI